MSEIRRIQEQMKRAFEGNAWHGPSLLETLEDVSPARAAAKPIPAAHSIWEIALHAATWKSVVARRVSGEVVGSIPDDEDWPPVEDTGKASWQAAMARLRQAHEQLVKVTAGLSDGQLDEPPYPKASSRYVQLHGVIQHDLYHAGQIAVLKQG